MNTISEAIEKIGKRTDKDKLERLHTALDVIGIPVKGRGKILTDRLNYSQGMISRLLSGKDRFSDRFVKTICREFQISEDYLQRGEGDILSTGVSVRIDLPEDKIQQKITDIFISYLLDFFEKSTESDLYRFYADLLECSSLNLVTKSGNVISIHDGDKKV